MRELDERTLNYFNQTKENMGFICSKNGYDEEEFEESYKLRESVKSSDVEVGKVSDSWCAQFGYQTAPDDYNIERLYFDRKPTGNNVQTIVAIADLEFEFVFRKLNPTFRCWECGRELHWLDLNGSIYDKAEGLKEKYCGC